MPFRSRYLVLVLALMMDSCAGSNIDSSANGSSAATDPNVPGATGRTIVIGSHSSMAGSNRLHPDWADAATDAGAGRR
jgi:hypothetical protein